MPSWAKAWLSILNAYEWEGVSPIPPELWCVRRSACVSARPRRGMLMGRA